MESSIRGRPGERNHGDTTKEISLRPTLDNSLQQFRYRVESGPPLGVEAMDLQENRIKKLEKAVEELERRELPALAACLALFFGIACLMTLFVLYGVCLEPWVKEFEAWNRSKAQQYFWEKRYDQRRD